MLRQKHIEFYQKFQACIKDKEYWDREIRQIEKDLSETKEENAERHMLCQKHLEFYGKFQGCIKDKEYWDGKIRQLEQDLSERNAELRKFKKLVRA